MKKVFLVLIVLLLTFGFSVKQAYAEDKESEQLSKEMLGQIVKIHGEPEEISDDVKVTQIFYSLVEFAGRKDVKYNIKVVKSKEVNAYAMPNGQVLFTTGLLETLPKDDISPIAFVCAHEIAHIEGKHAQKKAQNRSLWVIGIGLLVGNSDQWVRALGAVAHGLVTSGYSREMEDEADREGINLMRKANYDPNGSLIVFKVFEEKRKQFPDARIFPTHPLPSDRTSNAIAQMRKENIAINTQYTNDTIAKNEEPAHDNHEIVALEPQQTTQSIPSMSFDSSTQSINTLSTNYRSLTSDTIKRGYYIENWETRLINDLKTLFGNKIVYNDPFSRKKARSMTYEKYQSNEDENRTVLIFVEESYISYQLFFEKLSKDVLPAIRAKDNISKISVAVKRNKAKKYHIVILFEK